MDSKKMIADLTAYYKKLNVGEIVDFSDQKFAKEWLAEVAAIFKSVDETDFKTFSNLRQHVYPSIDRGTRKHAVDQIAAFVAQKIAEYKRYPFEDTKQQEAKPPTSYVDQKIIDDFIKKDDDFDYKKLIRLMSELNSNYASGHPYSVSMLIRGILDHIPPLLGCKTFDEVVSSYPWGKSDVKYMEKLLDFKNEGHDALHRQISGDADLLEMDAIPSNNRLNRLLQECLKGSDRKAPIVSDEKRIDKKIQDSGIKIQLVESVDVSWANYSQKRGIWSSFKIELKLDNFLSNKPDYISVSATARVEGSDWVAEHFMFQGLDKQDEEYRIEAQEVKSVILFVSDHVCGGADIRKPKPLIDKDSFCVHVKTKSGKQFDILVPDEKIKNV